MAATMTWNGFELASAVLGGAGADRGELAARMLPDTLIRTSGMRIVCAAASLLIGSRPGGTGHTQ